MITPKKEDKLCVNVIVSPMMDSEMKELHLSHEEPEQQSQQPNVQHHHFNYRAYESPSQLLNLRSPEKMMLSNIILFPHGRD